VKHHLKYASYVFRHKWFVFVECVRRGYVWRGLVHDLSKFLPDEWLPYANYFGKRRVEMGPKGYIHKPGDSEAFDAAWLRHQHRNPHHWQHWLLRQDDGQLKAMEMPYHYVVEMVCDWIGAGLAQGKPDTSGWFEANYGKMLLHPRTKKLVLDLLSKG
jgi:hypothetical protein